MAIKVEMMPFDINSAARIDRTGKVLDSGQGIDETQGEGDDSCDETQGVDSYEEVITPDN